MFAIEASGLFETTQGVRVFHNGVRPFSPYPPNLVPAFEVGRKLLYRHFIQSRNRNLNLFGLTPLEKFLLPNPAPRIGYTCLPATTIFALTTKMWNASMSSLTDQKTRSGILPLLVPTTTYKPASQYVDLTRPVLVIDLSQKETFPASYMNTLSEVDDYSVFAEQAIFNWLRGLDDVET